MDTFFDDSLLLQEQNLSIPAANVTEGDSSYTIKMAVPGLEKDDFNVEIDNNVLTVSSKKEKSAETQEDNFTRKEYSYSSFKRSFSIPENTNTDSIEANYKNGELILTIPKKEVTVSKSKLIEVA
jgi:HSP20 family protein